MATRAAAFGSVLGLPARAAEPSIVLRASRANKALQREQRSFTATSIFWPDDFVHTAGGMPPCTWHRVEEPARVRMQQSQSASTSVTWVDSKREPAKWEKDTFAIPAVLSF